MIRAMIIASALAASFGSVARAEVARFVFHRADLATAESVAVMYLRLQKTAISYCQIESRRSLKAFQKEKACVADVANQFVVKIADWRLTALHANAATAQIKN